MGYGKWHMRITIRCVTPPIYDSDTFARRPNTPQIQSDTRCTGKEVDRSYVQWNRKRRVAPQLQLSSTTHGTTPATTQPQPFTPRDKYTPLTETPVDNERAHALFFVDATPHLTIHVMSLSTHHSKGRARGACPWTPSPWGPEPRTAIAR